MAKDYLYRISRQVQLKKEMIQNPNREFFEEMNHTLNDSIQALINKFASTRLTDSESLHFESLQKNIFLLDRFENQYISNESITPEAPIPVSSEKHFKAIYDDLDALFKIQLEESNRVIGNSNKTIDSSNFISKIEIGVLIVIGVMIHLLIFLKPIK